MQKFQKKPVVIEAVQFTGSNHREVLSFVYPDLSEDAIVGAETMRLPVVIETMEGDMTASPGDWIIKGVKGEFYPCKPDIFAATYGPPANTEGASEFLRRATSGNYRIVNSGDLDRFQISEAQANGLFFVDPETSYGWALLPWDLTTTRDRKREADYFSRNNMMV